MFFVIPLWPRTHAFPLATAALISVQTLVFLAAWPAEKRQAGIVSGADRAAAARDLVAILKKEGRGLTDAQTLLINETGERFPSPDLTALFQDVQNHLPNRLTSPGQYRWETVYPSFLSLSRALPMDRDGGSVYRRYGFSPEGPLWPGILTHTFLHAGVWHFLGNMLFLWAIGSLAEGMLGGAGLWGAFVLGGGAAAWAQAAWGLPAGSYMVGASGAISAIMGFGLLRTPAAKTRVLYVLAPFITARYGFFDSPLWFFLPLWAFDQAIMGLTTRGLGWANVGYGAHLGGFAAGMAMAVLHRMIIPPDTTTAIEDRRP